MKISCRKFLNLAHYFPYDVKLRLLAHSRSFLANQKARNAIVGVENLLKDVNFGTGLSVRLREGVRLIGGPLKTGVNMNRSEI